MLNVTEIAKDELNKALVAQEDKDICIRVYVEGVGCSGPQVGLALDKKSENDKIFNINGVNFIVDSESEKTINDYEGLNIDFIDEDERSAGFSLSFNKEFGGCNSGCSCH
ncbi:MAG: iron-sulfur cluster assembly accessory protein [Candidatus Delongbacteria bacterium]|nr:iron-sulfur cluster assembly accessory protein [Candidatus Delongbacteria bacterium]MBN2834432.1 iron-sulfur cluster assembly accessory protein [Candidatus Delongbacteria bacterium]